MKKLLILISLFLLLVPGFTLASEAEDSGYAWRWDPSLEWIFAESENGGWIYHPDTGWSYLFKFSDGTFSLWNESNRWMFSSRQAFPACWVLSNGAWSVKNHNEFILNPDMYTTVEAPEQLVGKNFSTLGLYDGGLAPFGVHSKARWSLRFEESGEVLWHYSDVIETGTWKAENGEWHDTFHGDGGQALFNDFAQILYWKGKKYR